jgi:transcriptional regulator with XRE-family HTH domain
VNNSFGAWIRQTRDEKHMTRDELIEALKGYGKTVAPSTLTSWEKGDVNAPIHDSEFVEVIAKVFGVSVADVLRGSGYDLGPAYEAELDEQRRILLEAYDNGDLERLVRMALEAHAKRAQTYSRLEAKDTDTNEGEGSAATTAGRR